MGIFRRTCSHGVGWRALSVPTCVRTGNRLAFQDGIRAHVLINGSIEAALGLALLNSHTRQAALANASLLHTQGSY